MTDIDLSERFSLDAVPEHQDDSSTPSAPGTLNPIARDVAAQYRRDSLSPVMVSGILRLVEFALLTLSGLAIWAAHVGTKTHLQWYYPLATIGASLVTVVLLELNDSYQVPALMRSLGQLGRILLV